MHFIRASYVKRSLALLVSLCLMPLASVAASQKKPIVVAVIDWPSDFDHPMIAPYLIPGQRGLDRDASLVPNWKEEGLDSKFMLLDELYLLNRDLHSEMRDKLAPVRSEKQLGKIRELISESGMTDQPQKTGFDPFKKVKAFAKAFDDIYSGRAENLAILSTYLHGSHVDSLAVLEQDPSEVKLIHIPVPKVFVDDTLGRENRLKPEEYRAKIAEWVKLTNRVLVAYDVKAVNLSGGLFGSPGLDAAKAQLAKMREKMESLAGSRFGFLRSMGSEFELGFRFLKEKIEADEQRYGAGSEEFRRVFTENPEIQFFMAAGNSAFRTDELPAWDFTRTALPNVAQIAATDYSGKLADFSNRSASEIEFSAPGVDILGALAHGGQVRMSGTSMASPLALRSYIQILRADPELSREAAMGLFAERMTVPLEHLKGHVIGGRFVLPPVTALGQTSVDATSLANGLKEADWTHAGCPDVFAGASAAKSIPEGF